MCFISKLIIKKKKKKEKPLRYCYSYFIDEIERAEKFKTSTKPHIKKQPPDLNPKFDSRVHVLNHLSQLRYNMCIKCGMQQVVHNTKTPLARSLPPKGQNRTAHSPAL